MADNLLVLVVSLLSSLIACLEFNIALSLANLLGLQRGNSRFKTAFYFKICQQNRTTWRIELQLAFSVDKLSLLTGVSARVCRLCSF